MELCLALDLPTMDQNIQLLKSLKQYNIWIKIGFRAYIRDGKALIETIQKINPKFKIFLDLKLYDIPNTMADASEEIAKLNIDMFNIHASAGIKAMNIVMDRLKPLKKRPLVLAVTALTSFDNASFKKIYNDTISNKALEFAKDTYNAGLDGVVCSVYESELIKNATHNNFLTLTPAIRPKGFESGDQQRIATPSVAKNALVDFIVVGRPIYNALDPIKVIEAILKELKA